MKVMGERFKYLKEVRTQMEMKAEASGRAPSDMQRQLSERLGEFVGPAHARFRKLVQRKKKVNHNCREVADYFGEPHVSWETMFTHFTDFIDAFQVG
jgi:hypothetical protein